MNASSVNQGGLAHLGWLIPQWPAPASVAAVCTTRSGGHSLPPYDSLNLGDHVGDDPSAVAANRAALEQALQARPVFLRQVHTSGVLALNAQTPQGFINYGNLNLTVAASGTAPLSYQWSKDGAAIANATAAQKTGAFEREIDETLVAGKRFRAPA